LTRLLVTFDTNAVGKDFELVILNAQGKSTLKGIEIVGKK